MPQPTSLRLPASVKARLEAAAGRGGETPSALAVRLIDEGLRLADHPGVTFRDSPAHGRVAALAGGPDIVEVIDVLTGLEATGEARVAEAATWLGLHPSRIRVAIGYYAAFGDEVDQQLARRRSEAAEQRARYEVERAVLE